jgi:hypothetical protein
MQRMLTQSQRLRQTIALTRGPMTALIREVWMHPRLGELYPEFLFAIFGVTSTSASLMRAAAARAAELALGDSVEDPLAGMLAGYYLEHAEEETGHEQWLLDDLQSMGIARERVLERLPYPSVAALVGTQYYWTLHVHPLAFLGYIAVLESPAQMEFLNEVSERTGIPLSSMSAHVLHAKLDPEHVAEFDVMLDGLRLTAPQQDLLTVSAITTIAHLERVFAEVLERFGRLEKPGFAGSIFTQTRPVGVGTLAQRFL